MKLLELLVLLDKAGRMPDVKRYLETEKAFPMGWISKDELKARRDTAEEKLSELQLQFEEFLKHE